MAFLVAALAFVLAAVLCAALVPLFRIAFLATPGARSSHTRATPQGGGLVVVPVGLAFAALLAGADARGSFAAAIAAAMLLLMAVGAWDDRASVNPLIRLAVQALAAGLILWTAPAEPPAFLAFLPPAIVFALVLIAALWLINLTNFMDGIDLMTVSQFTPAFATVFWLASGLSAPAQFLGVLCLTTAAALLGFALLNRPQARLFLGDSGSLPLGALAAAAAVVIGAAYGPVVALLPFAYYLADATITLLRRVLAGEKFWQAHRDHFYQKATRRGLSTWRVIARVAACNILLCALALAIAGRPAPAQIAALLIGAAAVAILLRDLARKRG